MSVRQRTSSTAQRDGNRFFAAAQNQNDDSSSEEEESGSEDDGEEECTSEAEHSEAEPSSFSAIKRPTVASESTVTQLAPPRRSLTFPTAKNAQTDPRAQPRAGTVASPSKRAIAGNSSYQQMQQSSAFGDRMAQNAELPSWISPVRPGMVFDVKGSNPISSSRRLVAVAYDQEHILALPVIRMVPIAEGEEESFPGIEVAASGNRHNRQHSEVCVRVLVESGTYAWPHTVTVSLDDVFHIDPKPEVRSLGHVHDVPHLARMFNAYQKARPNLDSRQPAAARDTKLSIPSFQSSGMHSMTLIPALVEVADWLPEAVGPSLYPVFFHNDPRTPAFADAIALFDSGTTCDVVSPSFVKAMGLRPTPLNDPQSAVLLDRSSYPMYESVTLTFSFEAKRRELRARLLPAVLS